MPAGVDTDSASIRPRNRRGANNNQFSSTPNLTISRETPSSSRRTSPIPSSRLTDSTLSSGKRSSSSNNFSRGLLEGSWTPNWSSVQEFASSLLSGGDLGYSSEPSRPSSRSGNRTKSRPIWKGFGGGSPDNHKSSDTWGPAPPSKSRPTPGDIAAGSLREREAQLTARKRASVLESYDGVNGGLDVTGKFKRRNSDETQYGTTSEPVVEEHLCYLHHVQPTDTYAGIVLRYRCREYSFRKANGLWSQNNIQVRKHLLIPVDACETKGRPCEPPSYYSDKVDLLARTPQPADPTSVIGTPPRLQQQPVHDDYFSPINGKLAGLLRNEDEAPPWTHVKWVKIDAIPDPIEIVRVDRKAMGYFPPRRKRSVNTVSAFSTPRQSLDLSRVLSNTSETTGSPRQLPSRRQSSIDSRPIVASPGMISSSSRGRGNSLEGLDGVPAWMRRPGGVGTMGKSVHSPGPAKDYFNSWVNKRLPGFNIDSLPSMSVMGSESAHFGFRKDESSGIVESSFEEGRDAAATAANTRGGGGGGGGTGTGTGNGLELAAASLETWLRGAWAKRPATPRMGGSNHHHQRLRATTQPEEEISDLIELADTNSEDGGRRMSGFGSGSARIIPEPGWLDQSLLGSTMTTTTTTGRGGSDGLGPLSPPQGRSVGSSSAGASKGGKAD